MVHARFANFRGNWLSGIPVVSMEEKNSDLEAFRREWLASLASVATASSSSAVTLPLAPHYDPENAPLLPKYNPMGHYDPENAPLLPKYNPMGQEEVSPGDSNSCKREEERPLHYRTDTAKRKTKAVEFRKKPKFEEDLVEKLIADIVCTVLKTSKLFEFFSLIFQDEVTEIPFFDTSLPREVGIKVFSYLEHRDLCHCAQVYWTVSSPGCTGIVVFQGELVLAFIG